MKIEADMVDSWIGQAWGMCVSLDFLACLSFIRYTLYTGAGTNLDGTTCPKYGTGSYDPCYAAFLGLHITPCASGYFEVSLWRAFDNTFIPHLSNVVLATQICIRCNFLFRLPTVTWLLTPLKFTGHMGLAR